MPRTVSKRPTRHTRAEGAAPLLETPDVDAWPAPGGTHAAGLPWALLRPEAYPHPADNPRLHETHSSWVILVGPYAYKLKKPVDLGFLDFTTYERRLADCHQEVQLNRRLCPDVYLGVIFVVERDGAYVVGGAGRPVEPAVWMRRLPEDGMLPALLARGAVGERLVQRIGRQVARFHASAATGPGVDEHGSPATIRTNWTENFAQVAPFVGRTVTAEVNAAIRSFVEAFLREQGPLLDRRVARGRIRDGHGDLHAGSICVEGRRVHLYDCLQFTPRFRCADVAADVAFLAMDLAHHGRADLGLAFVDAYVRASGDEELRALLGFYTCYRAYVRGKVRSLRLAQPGLDSASATQEAEQACAYFDLAWAAAGGLGGPTLVVTMGLPASGKTTLAHVLAGRLGLVHLSSDVVRKGLAGLAPSARQPERFREGLYGPAMTRRTYATLRRRAAGWLRRGQSVVLDATYGALAERAAVRRLAARLRARLVVLLCQADEATLLARLAARAADPHAASDARLALWPRLRAAFTEPAELPGVVAIDTTAPETTSTQQTLAAVRRKGAGPVEAVASHASAAT